jgi:CRISPR system Cascade subunit CasE
MVDPELLLHIDDHVPNPATKDLSAVFDTIGEHQALVFRLRANATRRVKRGTATEGAGSTRVPLRGEAARLEWLHRQAEHRGFQLCTTEEDLNVPDVRVIEEPAVLGWRGNAGQRQRLTFASVLFEGRLQVRDRVLFRAAVEGGIGPAKAYGFGLLSVASARADH